MVEIRRATEVDVSSLVALIEAVAAEARWIATEAPIDRERRATGIRGALAREDAAIFVAVDGATVVGELGMYSHWPGLYELGMAIELSWRSKGVGSRLLEAAIAWACSVGAHKIALEVFPHNDAAIGLYEKFGFVREGCRQKHLHRKTGELWDVISMGLTLSVDKPGNHAP